MPLVSINLMQGREPQKIERMITAVSEAIAESLDAPIASVRIMVNEMATHQYGVGGKPWRVVVEERARAAAAAASDGVAAAPVATAHDDGTPEPTELS